MELKNIKMSPVDMAARKDIDMRAGDTVRVWQKIKEGEKSRLQAFEGMVLAIKHGKEAGSTFTVRKVIDEVGVERIFPLYSPNIDSVEVLKRAAKVRRSKLYYIRDKATKELKRHLQSEVLQARKEGNTDTKRVEVKKEVKEAVEK